MAGESQMDNRGREEGPVFLQTQFHKPQQLMRRCGAVFRPSPDRSGRRCPHWMRNEASASESRKWCRDLTNIQILHQPFSPPPPPDHDIIPSPFILRDQREMERSQTWETHVSPRGKKYLSYTASWSEYH